MSKNHYHDEEDQISSENISGKGSNHEIPSAEKRIRWYRLATIGFVVVTLIALVIGLSMSFLGTPNPFRWFQHGVAPSVNDTARWETYGFSGLELTVENALEDRWTPYFQEYIAQWDQGTPDSLKLSTTRVSTDSSCQPSLGVVKVCNGDYGDTDWLGVTFNLIQDGVIVLSTIKINDHHLDGMNDDDRKYTM
jgi:predicted metalloprotease